MFEGYNMHLFMSVNCGCRVTFSKSDIEQKDTWQNDFQKNGTEQNDQNPNGSRQNNNQQNTEHL